MGEHEQLRLQRAAAARSKERDDDGDRARRGVLRPVREPPGECDGDDAEDDDDSTGELDSDVDRDDREAMGMVLPLLQRLRITVLLGICCLFLLRSLSQLEALATPSTLSEAKESP